MEGALEGKVSVFLLAGVPWEDHQNQHHSSHGMATWPHFQASHDSSKYHATPIARVHHPNAGQGEGLYLEQLD
jgi:hypothetical protein